MNILLYKERHNTSRVSPTTPFTESTMKPTLAFALSSLLHLLAFLTNLPLAFSVDFLDQVRDTSGNGVFPGFRYYIRPIHKSPTDGGFTLGKTGKSDCPLTVFQENSDLHAGLSVKFRQIGITLPEIYPGSSINTLSI